MHNTGLVSLLKDFRYGVRTLRKTPTFTALTIAILALGIGANTAIFSLVHAVVLRELPYQRPSQLVWAWSIRPDNRGPFNIPDFIDYRDRNRTLEPIAALADLNANLTGQGEPSRVQGLRVSGSLFQTLGTTATMGRTLDPGDDRPGAPSVLVLTNAMWRTRLGGDPNVLGRKLLLNGTPYVVVGVLPRDFIFPRANAEFAIPLAPDSDPAHAQRNSINFLRVVGRLKPGVGIRQAEDDFTSIARQLRAEYPQANALKLSVHLVPIEEEILGSARDSLVIVLGAVSLLLHIVAVNVANSLLARAAHRRREVAIRAALGASRLQLAVQSITENLLLTSVGGALGIVLAKVAVDWLLGYSPTTFPRADLAAVNGAALLYAGGLSIAIGLLIGLVPATRLPANIGDVLKSASRGSAGGQKTRAVRAVLIVAEVALSFALLMGAGLLSRSLTRLNHVAPGFESSRLLAVGVSLPRARYNDRESIQAFLDRVTPRFDSERRVESYSVVSLLPLAGGFSAVPFSRKDRPVTPDQRQFTNYRFIGPNYFQTMGIRVTAGNEFSQADQAGSRPVAIVSDQFARRYLRDRPALGAHLMINDNDIGPREVEIVGVVGNVKQAGLDEEAATDLYVPLRQVPNETNGSITRGFTIVVRSVGDPRQLTVAIKNQILAAEPDAALTPRAVDDVLIGSLAVRQFQTILINLFAAFATLLAGFGLYGVMSYLTTQRFHEIGVRMALGATAPGVARLVIGQGLAFAALGMAVGMVLVAAGYQLISSRLYMTGLFDLLALGSSAALVLLIAAVASWLPALRAARVDPVIVLRGE